MTITETRPDDVAPPPPTSGPPAGTEALPATADHKRLGLLFLGGSLLFLVVGGIVGMALRVELADEGVQIVGGNFGRLFSLHATVSSLLFLGPAWIGLATYVVPLQLGAGRLALPRLHAFAAWTYLLGGGLLITAYLLGPPVGLGIADATPMAAPDGGASKANALAIVSMAMVASASVLAAVSLAVTVLKLRTPGLTLRRIPMFSWATLVTSLATVVATPVFLGGLLLLYIDQRFGGDFFSAENVAGQTVWQHTLWLFGRPEVYFLLLPGLGAACDIVATHAHRPLLSLDAARAHIALFALLSFGSWAAGTEVADAIVLPTYTVLTALVAAPVAILVLVWLATMGKGRPTMHTSLLFVLGFIGLLGAGALHAIAASAAGVDGSAWSTGHLHTVAYGAPTLLLAGAIHHWAPKLFGRQLSAGLGRVAFLGLFGGFFLLGLGSYLAGYDGAPAHVRDFDFSSSATTYGLLAVVGGAVVILGALALVADVALAMGGRSTASSPDDPYGGLTLEWATSSPPPPQGFDAVPEVRSAHPLLDLRSSSEVAGG
ncbi:MAG TPA: cbb3-type cytochrome c oxidase subunit I [Acidimicrobiales bacterium]|nr:cbb3-type cytochrome c oxidase subunit I [Acidimicrobiales bacterium]